MQKINLKLDKPKWDVLAITDPHVYGKNPPCRKDNLIEVQFDKLREIKDVANELKIPVICFGDSTNSPNISYGMFSEAGNILNQIFKGYYFLYGQHDLFFHDMITYNSTAMGAMETSFINIRRLDKFYIDHGIKINTMNWKEEINNIGGRILASHLPVVTKPWVSKFDWLRATEGNNKYLFVEDLYKDYDVILCGDWHRRYVIKYKNCTVINPGSLTRRKANSDSIETFPSYVLIQFFPLTYEIIPLKCAKPVEEVISDNHLEMVKQKKEIAKEVEEFIKNIPKKEGEDKNSFMLKIINKLPTLSSDIQNILKEVLLETFGEKVPFEYKPKKFNL